MNSYIYIDIHIIYLHPARNLLKRCQQSYGSATSLISILLNIATASSGPGAAWKSTFALHCRRVSQTK